MKRAFPILRSTGALNEVSDGEVQPGARSLTQQDRVALERAENEGMASRPERGSSSEREPMDVVRVPANGDRMNLPGCAHPNCRTAGDALLKRIAALESALLRATRLAHYDHMTGLANRRLLEARFDLSASLAKRNGRQLAVLFLDLDHFKEINDGFGHEAGDEVLRQVARRLCRAVRTVDTVCRYGGDEFVVLITEIDGLESARKVVSGILEDLAEPFEARDEHIEVKASHGLGTFPADGDDLSTLVECADREMYRNKGGGVFAGVAANVKRHYQGS